jgi:hypothetical protein
MKGNPEFPMGSAKEIHTLPSTYTTGKGSASTARFSAISRGDPVANAFAVGTNAANQHDLLLRAV